MTTNTPPSRRTDGMDDAQAFGNDRAFRMLVSGQVDLVADQLRDAYRHASSREEFAQRLRQVQEQVELLAEFAEAASEAEQ